MGNYLVLGDVVDGLSKVLDIVGGDTSHGDATVAGQVDVPVILELVDLLGGQAREAEHTNLIKDDKV